jgi:tRNA-splicing ligase RtcB
MGNLKLKGKDILKLGYPNNKSVKVALEVAKKNFADKNTAYVKNILKEILLQPEEFKNNLMLGQIAEELLASQKTEKECF